MHQSSSNLSGKILLSIYSSCILVCHSLISYILGFTMIITALVFVALLHSGLHSFGLWRRQYLHPRPPALGQHVSLTWPRPLTPTCKHSTLGTDTHMHTQQVNGSVSVISHTMGKVYPDVPHIIVPHTAWCVYELPHSI